MTQGVLELALPPVFLEDNFYTADCNRDAHAWIARWPDWPAHALILHGPAGAGKSHLGHIWANRTGAQILHAEHSLSPEKLYENSLVEDIEAVKDERALLHLINFSRENNAYLLLTSSLPPRQLPFTLPDLTSRLLALPAVGITAPDEKTLAAVLRKQFSDRQLKVSDDVIAFLLARMDRSFAKVMEIVEKLDKQALAEQRDLTIPFLKQTLGY